ncbi:MAG: DUF1565 domain-containing protein [Candidatus Brocadiia bacterium]|jgi:hypothetical protein
MKALLWSPFCVAVFSAVTLHARAARASVYVVDQAAPGAADTNLGTEESPFKTIQRAADVVKPGDTVCVMAGRYDERVKVKTSGSKGKPITFRAMPRRSAVVSGFDLPASYIRVVGFEITAGKPADAVVLGGNYCEVLDNYIHEMMVGVNGTGGAPSADGKRDYSTVSHNRIAYNKVYHSEYGFNMCGNDWLLENNEVNRLWMYSPGKQYDDCDYTRFFGRGCVERYNYFHGSAQKEIKVAHVDCLQTFTVNGEIAKDLVFEYNTCFDFHQGCMVESDPHIGSVRNWTFRGNIYSANGAPKLLGGGWGPDICQTLDVTIENCTISTVRWACIGLRGKESTNGYILNNILCDAERAVVVGDADEGGLTEGFTPAKPVIEYNLTYRARALAGETNINGKDPLLVDPQERNFRLRKGSPAIGAGKGGVTIGAMEWPNIWYVDPRHPAAADEPAWGYPGVPLATASKACAIAQQGETIVLRGGVYREMLRPASDGVTIRAMKDEKVTISGADEVAGWTRGENGAWWAPLSAEPKKLLRDGKPWSEFTYDAAGKRIMVKIGGDPRLHLFETMVRHAGIDLAGRKGVKVEGSIETVDSLGEAASGAR